MEIENGNRFYDENVNHDETENSFNSFTEGTEENRSESRKDGRPRFVKVDYGTRPQYARVERQSRRTEDGQDSYSQERPRRQYYNNSQYGQERPYYNQNRQGGYQNRSYMFVHYKPDGTIETITY